MWIHVLDYRKDQSKDEHTASRNQSRTIAANTQRSPMSTRPKRSCAVETTRLMHNCYEMQSNDSDDDDEDRSIACTTKRARTDALSDAPSDAQASAIPSNDVDNVDNQQADDPTEEAEEEQDNASDDSDQDSDQDSDSDGSEYQQSDDASEDGEESQDDDDAQSSCSDQSSVEEVEYSCEELQDIALSRLNDDSAQFQQMLCETIECTPQEIKTFVSCASMLKRIQCLSTADYMSLYGSTTMCRNSDHLTRLVKALGIDTSELDNSQEACVALSQCVAAVNEIDMTERTPFLQELIKDLPTGGALCKMLLYPKVVISVIVCAHAIGSARAQLASMQQTSNDILSLFFGQHMDAEHVTGAQAPTFCDSLRTTKARVEQWVASINALNNRAFLRRIVLNTNQISRIRPMVRRLLGFGERARPIYYGLMDSHYIHHIDRIHRKQRKSVVRVELRVDDHNNDGLCDTLGVDLAAFRLRHMGCGEMATVIPRNDDAKQQMSIGSAGVVCMSTAVEAAPFVRDPAMRLDESMLLHNQTMKQLIKDCFQAPHMHDSLVKLGFAFHDGIPVCNASTGPWVMCARSSSKRSDWPGRCMSIVMNEHLYECMDESIFKLFGFGRRKKGLLTIQMVPAVMSPGAFAGHDQQGNALIRKRSYWYANDWTPPTFEQSAES